MFKLHDKTRRFLTLSLFLLLGPALLLAVLGVVYSRHSVRTVNEWERLLTHALGKQVEMDGVSFPAPGMVRFSQMRVIDPETNTTLLQIPQWELIECFGEMPQHIDPAVMSQTDGQVNPPSQKNLSSTGFYEPGFPRAPYKRGLFASIGFACSRFFGKQPSYRHCEIPEISCNDAVLTQAKDVLLELMAKLPLTQAYGKQSHTGIKPTVLFVGIIDVSSQQGEKQKSDCVAIRNACFELRPTAEQTTFLATFHPVDQATDAQPFRLAVSRKRGSAAWTHIRFATGENDVPIRLLTDLDPFFEGFGRQSRFNGTIVAESSVDQQKKRTRTFELTDTVFDNVALESLLSKSLSFRFDGTADKVTLDSAKFRSGSNDSDTLRLEFAEGAMFDARGIASWPGLRRLVQGTGLQLLPRTTNPPDTDITFRDGTFRFQITSQGICLSPKLDAQSQPCPLVVIDNLCAVFWPNPQHVIRYDELLTALSQPNSQHIPLMLETQHLLSTLPITVGPGGVMENEASQQTTQRGRLKDMIQESSEPQNPPVGEPSPMAVQQQQFTPQQLMELQPPQTSRENVSSVPAMSPVPALDMPQQPYQQPYTVPQHVAMGGGSQRSESPAMGSRQSQENSYIPQPRATESPFLERIQDTVNPATPNPQPMQQPIQSLVTQTQVPQPQTQQYPPSYYVPQSNQNLAMAQPNGVPYGNSVQSMNNPQLLAAQQPQDRVVLTTPINGISNEVQMNSASGSSSRFNSAVPSTFELNPTQVAAAQQPSLYGNSYYDASATQPQTPSQPAFQPATSQPSGGQFDLWQSNR
ncbi:MAG: hypothetical protein FWH27_06910 [Planctomycetaceae bacterium]|nr:hypothetical protein [Planctomycetaceae bacterium]